MTGHEDPRCHPDCGPVTVRTPDGVHAHDNIDGRCWHPDNDGRIMDADLDIPEPGDGYGSDVRDWEDPDTDRLADGIAAGIVARCATRADLDAAERIVSATRYL